MEGSPELGSQGLWDQAQGKGVVAQNSFPISSVGCGGNDTFVNTQHSKVSIGKELKRLSEEIPL